MRKNAFNITIFVFLAGAMFFMWQQAEKNMPKKAKKDEDKTEVVDDQKKKDEQAKKDAQQPDAPKVEPKIGPPRERPKPTLIPMGDATFYNQVLLTTAGGGVQQVVLPQFGQADRLGREVKLRDADGNPTKAALPLYLIPGVVQARGKFLREDYQTPKLGPGKVTDTSELADPSYALFHYPTPEDSRPDPLMGEEEWTPADGYRDPAGAPKAKVLPTGEHEMAFEFALPAPYYYTIRKTYTLAPKEYHIGLKVAITKRADPGSKKGKGQELRLQLSGPRGLPVDGEWSATKYREAIVGWTEPKGAARRRVEDGASVGNKRGGEVTPRNDNTFRYMVVATQFFASGVAIDDRADDSLEKGVRHPWAYVRATTELPFDVKQNANVPYFDDLTVRAASEVIDLDPGKSITHSYLIYNGPSKPRLLKLMTGDRAVDPALVDRYSDALYLRTVVDFRSDTWIGRFASWIYWTEVVIVFTNLMHWLLAVIHSVIPNWAFSIIVLTVMVRLMLFYPSRKQTAMSMKMMELQKQLQPEFVKLQEKYKDDMGTYNREKMRLMMARGINPMAPLGGCFLLLAQMPIMMGLYFCLQESVFFRLESFLWIDNLAAPDMLIWWSEKIPYLSTPEDVGSFLYLGPFFNLLPVLAVGLMMYQQAKMMPPSTDPQAEQQRMMMKMMMVMMAVFFYKVAAGLSLYFIVSTAWGIIERQFIPKPKVNLDDPKAKADAPGSNGKPMTPEEAKAAVLAQKPKGFLGRLKQALREKMEEMQKRADEQAKRQIRNDPSRPGGQSPPVENQGPTPGTIPRDKKKKKRK